MIATELDSVWFHGNPDRKFRLRKLTPAEVERWAAPVDRGYTAWCIIRCEDGAARMFAFPAGDSWDDHDEEIEPFFDKLGEAE